MLKRLISWFCRLTAVEKNDMNWTQLIESVAELVGAAVPQVRIVQVVAQLVAMEAPQIASIAESLKPQENVTYEDVLAAIQNEAPDWHPKDSDH